MFTYNVGSIEEREYGRWKMELGTVRNAFTGLFHLLSSLFYLLLMMMDEGGSMMSDGSSTTDATTIRSPG